MKILDRSIHDEDTGLECPWHRHQTGVFLIKKLDWSVADEDATLECS